MNVPAFELALVTGASSGIGAALCHLLASKGIPLLITGRDRTRLEHLAATLRLQVPTQLLVADLNLSNDRQRLIALIQQQAPDLVINNAGFGLYGDALKYSSAEQLEILRVNGNAVLELTLETARALIAKKKRGTILNVASSASISPIPLFAVYAATKSFVVQMSQALDMEMEPKGVRVLVACPGMVATQFSTRAAGRPHIPNASLAMTPQFAAEQIWWQIEKQKPYYLFNWKYRIAAFLNRLLPQRWVSRFLGTRIADRIK